MLFKDERLSSCYDFGNHMSVEYANFDQLASEIERMTEVIGSCLREGDIELNHTDINGGLMKISKRKLDASKLSHFWCRSKNDISVYLHRNDEQRGSTFEKQMEDWGIYFPIDGSDELKIQYFKILYFFYFANELVFPQNVPKNNKGFKVERILTLLSKNNTMSSRVPIEGSEYDYYYNFILDNICDDNDLCVEYITSVNLAIRLIEVLEQSLSKYIYAPNQSENPEFVCERNDKRFMQIMNHVVDINNIKASNEGVIKPYKSLAYHLVSFGYLSLTKEILNIIDSEERPFYFEKEGEPCDAWIREYIPNNENAVKEFYKSNEVYNYCKNTNKRGHIKTSFVNKIPFVIYKEYVEYERKIYENSGKSRLLKYEGGEEKLNCFALVALAKACIDFEHFKIRIRIDAKDTMMEEKNLLRLFRAPVPYVVWLLFDMIYNIEYDRRGFDIPYPWEKSSHINGFIALLRIIECAMSESNQSFAFEVLSDYIQMIEEALNQKQE